MKDLDKLHVLAKAEAGFFKFIVHPLWNLLNVFLEGEIQKNVDYLQAAMDTWNEIYQQNKPQE